MNNELRFPKLLKEHESDVLSEWVKEQLHPGVIRPGLINESELRAQCAEFLGLLIEALRRANSTDVSAAEFAAVKDTLARLTRARGLQGFSPTETATFVFSLKKPLFQRLRKEMERDPTGLANEIWSATELLDKLGLLTTEIYQKSREEVISRQQSEVLELSTPVIRLWDGVLALPLIGTLDSARTQVVMETLLDRIVETSSEVAIIDITGVPTVDTQVAQHLLKTVSAARLMGVDCIISGIRPQIAQTIVHLAIDLGNITTKASLAEAFKVALQRTGMSVTRNG